MTKWVYTKTRYDGGNSFHYYRYSTSTWTKLMQGKQLFNNYSYYDYSLNRWVTDRAFLMNIKEDVITEEDFHKHLVERELEK